jgi:hypothetical protein
MRGHVPTRTGTLDVDHLCFCDVLSYGCKLFDGNARKVRGPHVVTLRLLHLMHVSGVWQLRFL